MIGSDTVVVLELMSRSYVCLLPVILYRVFAFAEAAR
jgi:hypothetical protein